MREPVRMRAKQHAIESRKRRAGPDPKHKRNRNNSRLTGVLLDPVPRLQNAGSRSSRRPREPRALVQNLRSAIVVSLRVAEHLAGLLPGVTGNVTKNLAGLLHATCRTPR